MTRVITPAVCLILLVLASGLVHGIKTDRWATSDELQNASERLDRVPDVVGDWRSESVEFEASEFASAGIKRAVFRRYRNSRSGAQISVLLECGRGGPISVHTPDICYAAAGYRASGPQERSPPNADGNEFWSAAFVKTAATLPHRLLVLWAWSREGSHWLAPERPRVEFARFPAVYKIYIVKDLSLSQSDEQSVRDFIDLFLRLLAGSLKPN